VILASGPYDRDVYFSRTTTQSGQYQASEFFGPSKFKLAIGLPFETIIDNAGDTLKHYTYPTYSWNGNMVSSDLGWEGLPIIEMDSNYIFLDILLYPE
jgi:hypothetical protein